MQKVQRVKNLHAPPVAVLVAAAAAGLGLCHIAAESTVMERTHTEEGLHTPHAAGNPASR